MQIYVTHGVVEEWRPAAFVDRNMLPRDAFIQHLRDRSPYVALYDACAGRGDALTVDDSTTAAADACVVARDLGHAVTLFVNPWNIAARQPYFFARLNAALDATQELPFPERRRLRRQVKTELLRCSTVEAIEAVVDRACAHLKASGEPPRALETITADTVRMLAARGVQIASHGWAHVEVANLTDAEFAMHLQLASEWISATVQCAPTAYAVPFGETALTAHRERLVGGPWFLAADRMPARHGTQGWNRTTLVLGGTS